MMRLVLTGFLLLLSIHFAFGQMTRDEREESARQAVLTLQEGGLVVRLNTKARKIAALEERLADPELEGSQRRRIEDMLTTTRKETAYQNQLIILYMQEKYQLGPLYFLPDTALSILQTSNSQGVFVNAQQELDPSIAPPQGDFLIMRIGYSDPSNTSRAQGFILMDSAQEVIPPPFPAVVTFNNAGFAINSLLAPEMAEQRRIQTAVERLVKKLERIVATYDD
jgi:hypothetical protein